MQKYLLDSNVFIQAHRTHYPFDVFPNFWEKLSALAESGKIITIDKVKKEICDRANQDRLAVWFEDELAENFCADSSDCVGFYAEIANWANDSEHYTRAAIDEFLSTDLADPWLIAYAKKYDCIIVTHETSQLDTKKRIKIPEPCIHFGVRFITPIEMFRELSETF